MESNVLEKSTNKSVALRLFAWTPRIQQIIRICDMDQFLRKPFWFFLRTFSIAGSMWLSSRTLYVLATMEVKSYTLVIPMSPLLERENAAFCPSVYCVLVIYGVGGARGVMIIVVGHVDTSSNPRGDWLHFT